MFKKIIVFALSAIFSLSEAHANRETAHQEYVESQIKDFVRFGRIYIHILQNEATIRAILQKELAYHKEQLYLTPEVSFRAMRESRDRLKSFEKAVKKIDFFYINFKMMLVAKEWGLPIDEKLERVEALRVAATQSYALFSNMNATWEIPEEILAVFNLE